LDQESICFPYKCGHVCMCQACAAQNFDKPCPVCRVGPSVLCTLPPISKDIKLSSNEIIGLPCGHLVGKCQHNSTVINSNQKQDTNDLNNTKTKDDIRLVFEELQTEACCTTCNQPILVQKIYFV